MAERTGARRRNQADRDERVRRWADRTGNVCPEHSGAEPRIIPGHRCVGCTAESGTITLGENGQSVMNVCGWQRAVPREVWEGPGGGGSDTGAETPKGPAEPTARMRVYVAGPCTGATRAEVMDNVNRAIEAGIQIFRRGHVPYVPNLTDLVDQRVRETGREMSWEDFMRWDAPWLAACDALLHLAPSRGADIELREAERLGKTIFRSLDEMPEATEEG